MSGYPYGNPQYPPPQGQIYPQIYNPVNAPVPQPLPGHPGFPHQPQYHPQAYPYQQAHVPAAMSYPNLTPMAPSAPPNPGFAYPGYPNIAPTPVYEPALEWIPTTPYNASSLTDRAVVAGYEGHDGSPLWVIRARFEGDLIPGKLAAKHCAAYVAWGGNENAVQNIEVCCARPEKVRWLESRDGVIPPNAIVGGNTKEGEPLYIGRAKHQGSLTPGKVHPSHKTMYMSFAGKEIPHRVYEVLCTV
ncbi:uncharacterized protein LOC142976828 [Anticarsia gemmatalis]|uniref:uncharacterized protein LOC142976828 n=1 Tax=Anticarsia gemmatalis TaxID=129554 RepID=UPI003F75C8CB